MFKRQINVARPKSSRAKIVQNENHTDNWAVGLRNDRTIQKFPKEIREYTNPTFFESTNKGGTFN